MHRGLAHRPPGSDRTAAEATAAVISELLSLALAGLAGFVLLGALMGLGVLPDPATHVWSSVVAGPILMVTAVATYALIERVRDQLTGPVLMVKSVNSVDARTEGVQRHLAAPLVAQSERMPWLTTLGVVLLHVGAAVFGSMVIGAIQDLLFAQPVTEQDSIVALVASGDPAMLTLLGVAAVVLAPLSEEALFRGFFFRRLRTQATVAAAWVLPALVFALAHWNPIGLAIYVWLGLVFAHAYSRTGRLAAAMLTHAGANAITFSLLIFSPPPEVAAAQAEQEVQQAAPSETP